MRRKHLLKLPQPSRKPKKQHSLYHRTILWPFCHHWARLRTVCKFASIRAKKNKWSNSAFFVAFNASRKANALSIANFGCTFRTPNLWMLWHICLSPIKIAARFVFQYIDSLLEPSMVSSSSNTSLSPFQMIWLPPMQVRPIWKFDLAITRSSKSSVAKQLPRRIAPCLTAKPWWTWKRKGMKVWKP